MVGFFILIVLVVVVGVVVTVRVGKDTTAVRADEIHEVMAPDLWRLRLCRYKAKTSPGEPVFFCHGFMANQFNFALPPGKSMADVLSAKGYDCWLIELRGSRSSYAPFGHSRNDPALEDYIYRDIPAALDFIRKTTGFAKVHWIGHSMGGMLLYCYDAAFGAKHLASGTTIGAPVGFDGVPFKRPVGLLALRKTSEALFRGCARIMAAVLAKFQRNSPLIPINWDNMHPSITPGVLFSSFEAPALPLSEQMLRIALDKKWQIDGGKIDVHEHLRKIQVPLFALFGGQDPFIPLPAAESFFKDLDNPDKKLLVLSKKNGHAADYNHVDLVMGRETEKDVFEPICAWLKAHPISEKVETKDEHEKLAPGAEVIESFSGEPAIALAVVAREARVVEEPAAVKKPAKKKAAAKKPPVKAASDGRKAPAKKAVAIKKPVAKKPAAKKPATAKAPSAAKKKPAAKPVAVKTAAKVTAKAATAAPKKAAAKKAAAVAKPAKRSEDVPAESVRAAATRAGALGAALIGDDDKKS